MQQIAVEVNRIARLEMPGYFLELFERLFEARLVDAARLAFAAMLNTAKLM